MTNGPLLSVRHLTTALDTEHGEVPVVQDVSFDIRPREIVAIVGESGSGKTMTVSSIVGLLPAGARVARGEVVFEGADLTAASPAAQREVRGNSIAMVFQDPMTSLNPLIRIGEQIQEGLWSHGTDRKEAQRQTLEMLREVGIPNPERAASAYPHEFSGGMRQRVMIAAALVMSPKLLIADEATSALDVTIQQQILELVRRLQKERGTAVLWITHDMGVVARLAERVLVMYGGRLVEHVGATGLFKAPEHPYTAALLNALPSLDDRSRRPLQQIEGSPPEPAAMPAGCPFQPRCPQAVDQCIEMPALTERRHGGAAACWVPPDQWTGRCSA